MGALIGMAASLPASKFKALSEGRLQRLPRLCGPNRAAEGARRGRSHRPPRDMPTRRDHRSGGQASRAWVAGHADEAPRAERHPLHLRGRVRCLLRGARRGLPARKHRRGNGRGCRLYAASHGSTLPLLGIQAAPWRCRVRRSHGSRGHLLFGLALEFGRRAPPTWSRRPSRARSAPLSLADRPSAERNPRWSVDLDPPHVDRLATELQSRNSAVAVGTRIPLRPRRRRESVCLVA